jgi:hypothetical protein
MIHGDLAFIICVTAWHRFWSALQNPLNVRNGLFSSVGSDPVVIIDRLINLGGST